RQRLVRRYVEKGTQLLDQGDWFGSLLWFAEALNLDQGDAAPEEAHRLRIASVLRQSPTLTQLWGHYGVPLKAEFSQDNARVAVLSRQE
ncbi:hypothetical protein NL298_26825, partial [Klebsiella pneumoniae]|nr:hypothetical protein [Klebsiella pneumoniae]